MLWSLLKEHKSLRGVVAFYDTGATFQADDPHAHLVALQERDGGSYAAEPAPAGVMASLARGAKRLTGGVRL